MNGSSSTMKIAQRFAAGLDHDDYDAAGAVIHPACVYIIRDKTIKGRDAILDSYRTASETGRATFDRLDFDSSVAVADDSHAVIDFIDDLTHKGRTHRHRCQQIVTIDKGLITAIEHRDLPGEHESIDAFKRAVGLATS